MTGPGIEEKNMIKNFVFDMGQVMIRWSPEIYMDHGNLTEEDRALLLREVFRSVEWVQLDRGSISLEEGAAAMRSRLPARLHDAVWDFGIDWYRFPMVPMPGMADLVRELKAKGYGIYLLSNCSRPLRQHFHRIPGIEAFDGVFISSEHRLLKPQHEIFEKFFRTFALKPEECFFVDDAVVNIEGALECGMEGALFRGDSEELRTELMRRNLL